MSEGKRIIVKIEKDQVKQISVELIEQNENSRVVYKNVDLAELMTSMRANGLLQPIGVMPLSGGKYDCIWGNRRLVAAKKLGWDRISCHVMDIETTRDRDILGLIENMKRQNTSVEEDGRIYQRLMDDGMQGSEIAARLDVPINRIQTALDVLNVVPEELRKKIVYSQPGRASRSRKKTQGLIAASTAAKLLSIRKSLKLNRSQTRQLFKSASDEGTSVQSLERVAPLVKRGLSVTQAMIKVNSLRRVEVEVFLYEEDATRLENKYDMSVTKLFTKRLCETKEFKIVEIAGGKAERQRHRVTSDQIEKMS